MKYKGLVLFLLLGGLLPVNVQAQWYRFLQQAAREGVSVQAAQAAALPRGLERAVAQAQYATVADVTQLSKSLMRVREKDLILRIGALDGTAFVLEETYQGKKYLWGVTATHYLFQKPALKLQNRFRTIPISFEIQGSTGMNDISLFPVSERDVENLAPLHLAAEQPKVGEELFSLGYWNGKIHIDPVRTVKSTSLHRFVTTLDIEPETIREGTCGSPVLNQQGEVVGMHAGNSPRMREGYVIPAQHIRQALQAYHEGHLSETLLFNGTNLGPIAINERIIFVETRKNGETLHRLSVYKRGPCIDYTHLETLLDFSEADQVVLLLQRNPLSTHDTNQNYDEFFIYYDLRTGQITRKPGETHRTPRY